MIDTTFQKAIQWVHANTVEDEGGIIVSRNKRVLYPEVTGYYIPSLLITGESNLASSFAKKLCSIQKPDGSWYDSDNKYPFIFDTGQIIKGLVAILPLLPEVEENIFRGIDWIFSNMNSEGRLIQPNTEIWGKDETHNNDLIHIYVLSPILEAARIFNRSDWTENANRVLDYYINTRRDRIVHYSMFNHFYAYVIEGLIDCGKKDIAIEAMKNFEQYRKPNGGVCAYNDVKWECSTAMFQDAIIWYKLGMKDKGDLTFEHTCSLQNETGGWNGCYEYNIMDILKSKLSRFLKTRRLYMRDDEISWAVKFYLDARYYKNMM